MAESDINQLLALNLRDRMEAAEENQTTLGKKSGVRQNTISLYLKPEKRKPSANGKPASGKLTEVAMMAEALGLSAWELLLPREAANEGGVSMTGWPLSPELLAALHHATPEQKEILESQARALLKMKQRPGPSEESDDLAG